MTVIVIAGLAAIWLGAATLVCVGWWRLHAAAERIPRCACGKVPLADRRNHLDHPAVRHGHDLCCPQREVLR